MSKDYIEKLHQSSAPVVYLINDMSGFYANPDSVTEFSQRQGTSIRINDALVLPGCLPPEVRVTHMGASRIEFQYLSSPCTAVLIGTSEPLLDNDGPILYRTLRNGTSLKYQLTVLSKTTATSQVSTQVKEVILNDVGVDNALLIADPRHSCYRFARVNDELSSEVGSLSRNRE
jgi:hypothetical protein